MKDVFFSWWRTRTPREQRMLLAMGALAFIVFAWLLIVRPLSDSLSDAKERHGEAVTALGQTRNLAAALQGVKNAPATAPIGPIDALVAGAAAEAGFPVSRLERHNANQVTLVVATVRPQAFFAWAHQMEEGRGLIVDRLSATTNTDRTLAVQIGFRKRAQ